MSIPRVLISEAMYRVNYGLAVGWTWPRPSLARLCVQALYRLVKLTYRIAARGLWK